MQRPSVVKVAAAMLSTLMLGFVIPASAQISASRFSYHDGCNGALFANGVADREELVNLVVDMVSTEPIFNARCNFTVFPPVPELDLGVTTFPEPTNPGGIVGDIPPGFPVSCRTSLVMHAGGVPCSSGPPIFILPTVTSSSHPPIFLAPIPFVCSDAVLLPATIPPEVCNLFLVSMGTGILFSWTPAAVADSYNLYRGDLFDTFAGIPDLVALPPLAGFCNSPGKVVPGELPCTCSEPGSCIPGVGLHLEFLDPFEEPLDFVYKISGEKNCLTIGEGAEGTLGSFGSSEHPYGGGFCPPM